MGIVNVKSSPVQFYVQRNSTYSAGGVIRWELARLNIGGAMNLETGVFTAPHDGVYHFHFSGNGDPSSNSFFFLRSNGVDVGIAYAKSNLDSASLHSTLQLKKGDRIDLWLTEGTLADNEFHSSHFTGWLDDEDLQL